MGRTPIPKPLEYCFAFFSICLVFSSPPSQDLCFFFVFFVFFSRCFCVFSSHDTPKSCTGFCLQLLLRCVHCTLPFIVFISPHQPARLAEQFAFPRQLLSCLRMTGTPASPASLCKLSFVGVTLLRCTSATFMAIVRGNTVPECVGS